MTCAFGWISHEWDGNSILECGVELSMALPGGGRMAILISPPDDDCWMKVALEEARLAFEEGEAPVGAVVVRSGRLLSRAHDRRQRGADPTAHAEILALGEAGRVSGDWRLDGCELFATLEPCPMCAGAAVMSRIRRVVYGARNEKSGAIETHCRLLEISTFNHTVEALGGVGSLEAAYLLKKFFRGLRDSNS